MPYEFSSGEDGSGEPDQAKVEMPRAKFNPTLFEFTFFLPSLLRQLRDRWRNPIPHAPKDWFLEVRGLPLTEMRPWYRDFPNQIRLLFERTPAPPEGITSQPIEVRNIWQNNRWQPASLINSLLLHALTFAVLTIPFVMTPPKHVVADSGTVTRIYYSPAEVPALANAVKEPAGGSGGGNHSPRPASVGRIPHFARVQLAPPTTTINIVTPMLAVPPTLIGPPELKLPEMQAHLNWGDPNGVAGPDSDGPGKNGGIGDGDDSGVGSKKGPGYGVGDSGSYSPGFGGVTAAKPIYSPPPNYSEDARKAKLQGTVILSLVVDEHGNPINIRVVRSLGMGLDDNAVEATRNWKFTPGTRNGVPVPVRMLLEVQFRLF